MFDISVIIINYNSSKYTTECIESIIEKTSASLKYEIIVVDNCSEEPDYNALTNSCNSISFPNLLLVRSKINTGFGGGNMHGVQYATGKYIAFVNNDSLLKNDCFSILKETLDNNPSIGMVGGQSFTEDGKRMQAFDHFASLTKALMGRDFIEKINPKKFPKRKSEYTMPLQVSYVQGSFMMLRTADFNRVGGFDTNLFLYHEETDLATRLKNINKSCYLIPEAQYIHYHGMSTPSSIDIKIELKISHLYVIRKHCGYLAYKVLNIHLIINYFFKSIFKPKYWKIFNVLFIGAPLSKSLKTKQKIVNLNTEV
ncbi:glycosyltransferase family 2 protein [Flavobacterium faecale]|uniref:glycosyltransferase family 2 protein n=1 Tax=Flavobacterium faecale TaxID=1355330 RepID=UPI003AAF3DD9